MLTDEGNKAALKVDKYFDKIREEIPEGGIDVNLQTIIDELNSLDKLLDNYISRSGL